MSASPPKTSKKSGTTVPAGSTPSSAIRIAINVLSVIRIATGAACLIAPRFTCAQHEYDLPVEHAFAVRMMGIREGVNGGLLLTAGDQEYTLAGKREIRRAVWAGMIADATDIVSLTYGFTNGQVGKTTALIIGGAAVGAITLAKFILNGL